ncbi:MAG: elongation factor Ts [Actinomycetota bacterium]|nr:elongation factor Ts [Actinomycetota bacterium]
MNEISAQDVMRLRRSTGAAMMDAKRALQEAGGDPERARELLREKGLADARKRAGRAAGQGAIGHYLHTQNERPVIGVLVELASETDFVAKNELFVESARDLAMHVAAARPRWVRREDVPAGTLDKERELITRQAGREGKPEAVIPKIVEGRLRSFYQDNVLYEQEFVNPDKFKGTVGEMVDQLAAKMGENIGVRRFSRLVVGEEDE